MRRRDEVGQGQERVVVRRRLLDKDVERSPRDPDLATSRSPARYSSLMRITFVSATGVASISLSKVKSRYASSAKLAINNSSELSKGSPDIREYEGSSRLGV